MHGISYGNINRKNPGKMVLGKNGPRKNGPRKNGPREKWSPEKWSPEKWSPENWSQWLDFWGHFLVFYFFAKYCHPF